LRIRSRRVVYVYVEDAAQGGAQAQDEVQAHVADVFAHVALGAAVSSRSEAEAISSV
jgi:hypothetical protein